MWKMRDGRVARLIGVFAGNGVIGVASLRMLPLAPFMLINLAAGAARVPFLDFAVGSALGLGPGIVAFNLMGVQLEQVLTEGRAEDVRSEEHTSELQSLMRISYAVFCLKK